MTSVTYPFQKKILHWQNNMKSLQLLFFVITNDFEEKVDEYIGGMKITQNIRRIFNEYAS